MSICPSGTFPLLHSQLRLETSAMSSAWKLERDGKAGDEVFLIDRNIFALFERKFCDGICNTRQHKNDSQRIDEDIAEFLARILGILAEVLTGFFLNSAGELTTEELERIVTILQTPTQYKIPSWFLNRQRDITDGKDHQMVSNGLDSKLREDLERLKKIRSHRGLRHYWGLRVRGQHTKTTGRRGRTVGVSKKKG